MPHGHPLHPRPLIVIYTINMAVNLNTVSRRHKHSPETLIIHVHQCIPIVLASTGNARQLIIHLKHIFFSKISFLKILFFENFVSFDLI